MVNKVLGILIASDFLLQAAWGFIGPIFALFLTEQIQGGSIQMVGFAVAVYWVTKSGIQPFLAHFLDVTDGEKDDFWFLVAGMFMANLVPFGFLFATNMFHIFILQVLHGIAMAMVVPSWAAIFTRHIQKGWEAFSWSIESTALGFAAGLAAAFGGILAGTVGFKVVFLIVCVFGLLSSFLLLLIRNHVSSPKRVSQPLPPKEKLTH